MPTVIAELVELNPLISGGELTRAVVERVAIGTITPDAAVEAHEYIAVQFASAQIQNVLLELARTRP